MALVQWCCDFVRILSLLCRISNWGIDLSIALILRAVLTYAVTNKHNHTISHILLTSHKNVVFWGFRDPSLAPASLS